jgi:SSS family solute:Na+ symporter
MQFIDYLVLASYFVVMIVIGVISSLRIKKQEDFFLGGRSFGKLLQTFAAFGAGTGSSDPVNAARTTFTSGMSGMWSVMYWLFVTPFYWITGVWYRRMRHLTLGDWFVERYESRALGAGYCFFGLAFFMVYGSMMFSAIGKVAAPLIGFDAFELAGHTYDIEYMLVPIIGVVVLLYGILGGLRAAYFTDLIQGVCIILLSIILIPYGLDALVTKFDPDGSHGLLYGFHIMHEQLPSDKFSIVGSGTTSEFPLYRIVAVVIINLVGIVVQPHFIATGGGSAKTETNARVGLVVGNFLKRFCTVGWVLTALIVLTLFADQPDKIQDPDKVWGLATIQILGPLKIGLVGLMLACLLAALMSSVDAYMIVGSGLMVRNLYAPYINPNASEKQYVRVARLTGVIVVAGAVLISLFVMNVFEQLQLTWVFPVLFAAPFWVGMYWRRATTTAAWVTVAFCALTFFVIPFLAPRLVPGMGTNDNFMTTNQIVEITDTREASPSDVAGRTASIEAWDKKHEEYQATKDADERVKQLKELGDRPEPLKIDENMETKTTTGGQSVFWGSGVKPVDANGEVLKDVKPKPVGEPTQIDDNTTQVVLAYDDDVKLQGFGNFKLDFLLYQLVGVDLTSKSNAFLSTLELPVKIVSPFLVMILVSLFTRRNSKEALDRYYAKMKTPVDPDPEADHKKLEAAYKDPGQFESKKLFPGTSFEFSKPTLVDIVGFVVCFLVCFGVIALAVLVASIGSSG